jgi:hypothetical protein
VTLIAYFRWLKKDWAKVGFILCLFLFVFLFAFAPNLDFVVFVLLLQTPLYMLHQTEEYVFPGGFAKFFNTQIFHLDTADEPLNETFIFYVNVMLIWLLLPACGLLALLDYRWGLWIPYFSFFAGVAHIALSLRARTFYNPGLAISLLLNIPVGLWAILTLLDDGILTQFVNSHFFVGLGVNALLPVMGILLLRRYQSKLAQ